MDARSTRSICAVIRTLVVATVFAALLFSTDSLTAAGFRTQNFIVTARNRDFAAQVAELAERYRADLAVEWLGEELPPWPEPCPIEVTDAPNLGAGGATSFMFDRGRPFGWTMSIQGSRQRILDSVLPHEVTHTIFATHFGSPVPRWADEGACTTVEHASERAKQQQFLIEFLTTGRGIPFNRMFRMTEYPHDIMPLYSQGHSLAQFLVSQGGKRRFVDFVGDGMASHNWDQSIKKYYRFDDLSDLQLTWVDWVKKGSPALPQLRDDEALAATVPAIQRQPQRVAQADRRSDRSADTHSVAVLPASTRLASRANGKSWYAQQAARAQQTQQTQEHVLEWNDESLASQAARTSAPLVPPGYAPQGLPVPSGARSRASSPFGDHSQAAGGPWSRRGNVWR